MTLKTVSPQVSNQEQLQWTFTFLLVSFQTRCFHTCTSINPTFTAAASFFSLHLPSSSLFMRPATEQQHHRAAESYTPLTGHQGFLRFWSVLLPAGSWMSVPSTSLRFDSCCEMKVESDLTTCGFSFIQLALLPFKVSIHLVFFFF